MLTSLTLSVMATRTGRTGSTVLERAAPVTKSAPAPGGSTPIQIQTPGGGAPTTVNVPAPAQTAPPAAQPPAAPAKK
ncbi:MAG: hypothetical protein JNL62_25265 [Bryobacterales bacterium]|nr:hypothetical protein [Bryobacterales bacterium]